MVAVERAAIETLCDEHAVCQRVLDRDDRSVPSRPPNRTWVTTVSGGSAGAMMLR
jgi:hypothetical protein